MREKTSSLVDAARATLIGGVVFLIPGFIVFFVLNKVFNLLKTFGAALGSWLGIELPMGGALLDLAAIVVVMLICFLAGLLASRGSARRLRAKLDQLLLGSFPGYAFVKGLAESMQHSQEMASSFIPVLLQSDDTWQMAFETDRMPHGLVAIYLPGAPNPWSGSVIYVPPERVKPLGITLAESIQVIGALGRGSEQLASELRTHQYGK
jgi:uncharacterized membrane protein